MPGATCCNGVPRSSSCTPSSISAWVTAAPAQPAVLPRDGAQFGQAGDVDDDGRTRQPQVQHGSQRLPAGHELGAAFVRAQRPQGLLQRARTRVFERGGLHAVTSALAGSGWRLPCAMAASTRVGDSGVRSSSAAPSGRSASLTALNSTAGG